MEFCRDGSQIRRRRQIGDKVRARAARHPRGMPAARRAGASNVSAAGRQRSVGAPCRRSPKCAFLISATSRMCRSSIILVKPGDA